MYVDSLARVRVKWGESERFKIDKWDEIGLHHVPLAFQYVYGCSDERGENGMGMMVMGDGGTFFEGV